MKSRSISWIAAIWLVPLCLYGAPRIPKDDREVLEQLPARRASTRSKIGAPVGSKTLELPEAVSNAWRLVQASRAEADPRLLGRAQALLSTWWDLPTPPAEVRLLRATIRQSLHDFPAALSDLNILVQEDPQNAQAWLTKATVHAVRGEWKEARKSAIPLTSLTSRLVSATVAGSIAGVNGQPEEAFDLIRDALKNDRSSVASIRVWSLTSLAEIAARLGRFPQAEEFFRSALALDPNDLYALGAYTDLLLFQRRPDEVLRRLEGRDAVDGLLLRQALAVAMQLELTAPSTNQASSSGRLRMEDRLAELRTLLQSRWDASRARGEATHQREEARFALQLMHDPARAIRLARENWRVQKEPADVKILMESAAAAGDLTTLEETRRWVEDAGLKDVTLAPFLKLEDAHR